jgi:chaperonin GroES
MQLIPLGSRAVVRRENPETTTPNGIIIPGNAQEKSVYGTVVAVGPGTAENPLPANLVVGCKVLFGQFAGTEIKLGGEEMLVVQFQDLMGILQADA